MDDKKYTEQLAKNIGKKLRGKQTALKFDNTPTNGSVNPVTSEGIKEYVDNHSGEVYRAGSGISIQNNIISNTAQGKIYKAGNGISIQDNLITNTSPGKIYTAGDGIEITENNTINKTPIIQTTHTNIPNLCGTQTSFTRPSGATNFGYNVWTDGDNIYYSRNRIHKILDKSTYTGSNKTWSGLTSFDGNDIGTDGDNIYYSTISNNVSIQYILDKSTYTGTNFSGNIEFHGHQVGTDGENIYCSKGNYHYILRENTGISKTGNIINFTGQNVGTDGEDIYFNNGSSTSYILDKMSSKWVVKQGIFAPGNDMLGVNIGTDGENTYYSDPSTFHNYILDKVNSKWVNITFKGLDIISAKSIGTDGENIFVDYNQNYYFYVLKKILTTKTHLK